MSHLSILEPTQYFQILEMSFAELPTFADTRGGKGTAGLEKELRVLPS